MQPCAVFPTCPITPAPHSRSAIHPTPVSKHSHTAPHCMFLPRTPHSRHFCCVPVFELNSSRGQWPLLNRPPAPTFVGGPPCRLLDATHTSHAQSPPRMPVSEPVASLVRSCLTPHMKHPPFPVHPAVLRSRYGAALPSHPQVLPSGSPHPQHHMHCLLCNPVSWPFASLEYLPLSIPLRKLVNAVTLPNRASSRGGWRVNGMAHLLVQAGLASQL